LVVPIAIGKVDWVSR